VWKAPLAWQVAAYLGLTCFIYFATIAWLPSILQEAGDSSARAGALHGWMQLAGAVPALLLMPLLQGMADQRWISFASPALSAIGLVGLLTLPALAPLWVFAFGMGMGAALVLSLAFVGLRAANQKIAASLSGMSQCIGYLLAAAGPIVVGFLHESSGGWTAPLVVCTVLCFSMCGLGLSVGQARHIEA
jgi:CP family cyanate transporter-like MFS transporter